MPWNWDAKKGQSIHVGGETGSLHDAKSTSTWPNYEAAYLAKRLGREDPEDAYENRYKTGITDEKWQDSESRQVYLDKVTENYKQEADECLKAEFVHWLQGTHDANINEQKYPNQAGQAKRRATSWKTPARGSMDDALEPGQVINDWNPTWWGQHQLTHLPGVRDFLRSQKEKSESQELQMNLLAEYGPQNIDQAWAYFKHWVKGRPIAPEECVMNDKTVMFDEGDDVYTKVKRAEFGLRAAPTHMAYDTRGDDDLPEEYDGYVPFDDVPMSEDVERAYNTVLGATDPTEAAADAARAAAAEARERAAAAKAEADAARVEAAAAEAELAAAVEAEAPETEVETERLSLDQSAYLSGLATRVAAARSTKRKVAWDQGAIKPSAAALAVAEAAAARQAAKRKPNLYWEATI